MLPRLKWHKLRRRWSDPPFLRANLLAGLEAGAALEVDLGCTADGHFVCLHDATLDAETTGTGPVAGAARAELMRLQQRGRDGAVVDAPPLFLDEVVAAVGALGRPPAGLVQLDLKEPAERISDALLGRLGTTLGAHAGAFVAGSTDQRLLERLGAALPALALGFDPLDLHEASPPSGAAAFVALAETTLRLAPGMRIYYLQTDLVLAALRAGVNLIERVAGGGAEVDVWTLDPDRPSIGDDLRALVDAGCHQITTNDAEALEPMLRRLA